MKNSLKWISIAAVYLIACYGIGQLRNSLQPKDVVAAPVGESPAPAVLAEDWSDVQYASVQSTTDTPWGFNAGTISEDDVGTCSFLTPGTGLILPDVQGKETLSFQYKIHPQVASASDGAGLLIWIMDKDGTILQESDVPVSNEQEWTDYTVELSVYPQAASLQILCNNGENDDDAADWALIKGQ